MSLSADVIRVLISSPALSGYKAHGKSAVRRQADRNELVMFLDERPWSTTERPDLEMTLGVRSAKLAQFDRDVLQIPQPRWPRLGRMHYERSLGWLLRGDEPKFHSGGPATIAEQLLPVVVAQVLPHLEAHAADDAIAAALFESSPLETQTTHDLMRLLFLLETGRDAVRARAVSEALSLPDREQIDSKMDPVIDAVTAEIARQTGAVAVKAPGRPR